MEKMLFFGKKLHISDFYKPLLTFEKLFKMFLKYLSSKKCYIILNDFENLFS